MRRHPGQNTAIRQIPIRAITALVIVATLAIITGAPAPANGAPENQAITLAIVGPHEVEVPENQNDIAEYETNNPFSGTTEWSVAESGDGDSFAIEDGTLKYRFYRFSSGFNFEYPQDDGEDNTYTITLTAKKGGQTASLEVAVTVTDVDEPPRPRHGAAPTTVAMEWQTEKVIPAQDWFIEEDEGDTLTYTLQIADPALTEATLLEDPITGVSIRLRNLRQGPPTNTTLTATDEADQSASITFSVRTSGWPDVPEEVTISHTHIQNEKMELNWSPALADLNNELTRFQIQYRENDPNQEYHLREVAPDVTTRTIPNLTNGTEYEAQIRACAHRDTYPPICGPWRKSRTATPQNFTPAFNQFALEGFHRTLNEPSRLNLLDARGNRPITTTLTSGPLPAGLNIQQSTTVLKGTPTETGTFPVTITIADEDGETATGSFNIVINATNTSPTIRDDIDHYYLDTSADPEEIDLRPMFTDPDGDPLWYITWTDDSTVVGPMIDGKTLKLTPQMSGTTSVYVNAQDRHVGYQVPPNSSVTNDIPVTVGDLASMTITADVAEITEGQELRFTVSANRPPPIPTEVKICISQGIANFLADDMASSLCDPADLAGDQSTNRILKTVTFTTTETSKDLTVLTENDMQGETNAKVTATVIRTGGEPYKSGNPASAMILVTDDDTTGLPDEPRVTTLSARDGRITLEIELGHNVDSFQVQQYQGTTPINLPFDTYSLTKNRTSTGNTGPTTAEATIGGLLNGVEYRYRVVSTNDHGESISDDHVIPLPLVAPRDLDLTPLNLRKAKASWLKPSNNLPNTKYEVSIKPLGSADLSKVHREVASDNSITITLDNVLASLTDVVGLQEPPYAYEIHVKALSTGTGISDTGFAEQLIMIDTPITQADGKSNLDYGMATLTWNAVNSTDVLGSTYANGNYHFRYRRMGGQLNSNYWDPTTYLNDLPTGYVGNKTSHVIPFLNLNDIYAIQLKYDLITPTRTTRVYSARDVYVWPAPPSDTEHGNQFPDDRLASYQFFGHWPDRQFHYTICENTFDPTADQAAWTQMINHAYANWKATSAELITVHPNTATCAFPIPVLAGLFNIDFPGDYSPDDTSFGMVMSTFNRTNQIYMVNVADWRDNRVEYAKVTLNEVFLCIFSAPACVISSDYYNTERSANLKLDRSRFTLKMQPGSVDMLINREKLGRTSRPNYDPRNVPGINQVYNDDDIPFNTCLNRDGSRVSNLNTDDAGTFFPYKTVVHEVGHTLGLSGYQLRKVIEDLTTSQQEASYVMSHPTIPDSTMNYDSRVRRNHVSGIVRFEPDCSPHPFDLMALHALYQTVKR